ncbi:MAG TPA: hypothetical protein VK177_10695 [Flavobacteriales bacterium]|nr:hypothetical protein [Flavobacteriales bacterium]
MKRLVWLISVLFITCLQSYAQEKKFPANKEEKAKYEEAGILFTEGEFEKAFELYKNLEEGNPGHSEVLLPLAISAQNLEGGHEMALSYFEKMDKKDLAGTDFPYYYGLSLHMNYRFQESIDQMNIFLKSGKHPKEQKEKAEQTIRYCENGLALMAIPAKVRIETLGDPLNTPASEYAPMISADEKTIVSTYRGDKSTGGLQEQPGQVKKDYNEDVQIAYKDSAGYWFEPLILQSNINTVGNDACVAISPDAQYLYLFRSIEDDPGSLYKSELDGYTWTDPELLKGDVNSKWWEGSITISHDGRKVFFASERPGGLGGRDIYEARLMKDGSWGNVKNIGTVVNTKENDDAPFLHPSGKYLVFSSEGHTSMGGFDIFVSELNPDSTWGKPVNIGYPINSTTDDKFYTVTADGHHGYYSSGKKGGLGKQDIYKVSPGIDKNVVLCQVIGDVYLDDYPTFCEIEVTDDATPVLRTMYNSNSLSGKFLVVLPPEKKYKLKFMIGGMEPKEYLVDAKNIAGFVEKYLLVKFYTDGRSTSLKEVPADSIKALNYALIKEKSDVNNPEMATAHHKDTTHAITANNTATNTTNTSVNNTSTSNTTNNTATNTTNNTNTSANTTTNNNTTNLNADPTLKVMPMPEFVEYSNPKLTFRVQVGAYRFPQNFKVEKFERDEKSKKEMLTDGITRFTIKEFNTLKEAYAYRDEMVKLGVSDAFVTAIYKGKRFLLSDLRLELARTLNRDTN